ncbi:hypothetical protein [Chryseobacterium sp.]|uniref:hypothetical protein n=1 Tax=Chryseobacterium sp. TaxID=1871047 RepID=UPI0025C20EA2|nr:hypothetical protein [Chryseobacterium sp.]MBV8327655.1 hypothetical protein [Chryseobacterium sp.]
MEEKSNFDEFDTKNNIVRRRSLLPLWIKIFLWFFLIGGTAGVILLLTGFLITNSSLSLYGIRADHPYSAAGLFICFLFIFKGIVSYGLWFEQKWGPKVGIIDAVSGILICIFMMIIAPFTFPSVSFNIRLELVPLLFYLMKMIEIRKTWENL